jgi:DNA processing protein
MSGIADEAGPAVACEPCLRRSWLLARLSASLDYRCADIPRLTELLSLEDEQLLGALAGSRLERLRSGYASFDPCELRRGTGVERICRHAPGYPPALRDPGAPWMLNVLGGAGRLTDRMRRPSVAVVGTRRASDYGLEMARSLGRGLTASGVTLVSGLVDGISAAAHTGALEGTAACVAAIGGGLDAGCPARRRSLLRRLSLRGCVVSELPCDCPARRWAPAAAERTVARLADVIVVVEAGEDPRETACATIASALGRIVAALPGRVTSPGSQGTIALLMAGAELVRGAEDVLDLLPAASHEPPGRSGDRHGLEPRLAGLLERVGAGMDTPQKLSNAGGDAGGLLLALTELELMGLLTRGEGGRYVPRDPLLSSRPRTPQKP